jgi:Cysteine-rich CPXCG
LESVTSGEIRLSFNGMSAKQPDSWRDLMGETELLAYDAIARGENVALPGTKFSKRTRTTAVLCPVCGEEDEVEIDVSGGAVQDFVLDCVVCCRPRHIHAEAGDKPGQYTVTILHQDA